MQCSLIFIPDDQYGLLLNGSRLFLGFYRKLQFCTLFMCHTDILPRTFPALGFPVRYTDHGAKLHQCLIKISRSILGHHSKKLLFHLLFHSLLHDITVITAQSGKNSQHISIHRRYRFPVGNGSNGTCRIASDSGKSQKLLIGIRHDSSVFLHDLYSCFI